MKSEDYFLKADQNEFLPLTDNRLEQLEDLVYRVKRQLKKLDKKGNNFLLEKLHAEIDSQIILIANWISQNRIPESFWYSSLLENAKSLGVLKKEVEFHLPLLNVADFDEVSNFYGPIGFENSKKADYNEKQYVEFLQHFNGKIKLQTTFFENRFDGVNKDEVYDYFLKTLVNTSYLTEQQLKNYLILGFDQKRLPDELFSFFNKPNKLTIRKVFHDYQHTVSKNKHKKPVYVKLLSNYFLGHLYTNTYTNWTK